MVNVTDLLILAPESKHPHALSTAKFKELFTADRPVIFNYHGYATELKGLLFGRGGVERMTIAGYDEEGSTTTPFEMMVVNGVSRFAVAERALRAGAGLGGNEEVKKELEGLVGEVKKRFEDVRKFIRDFGKGKGTFWGGGVK